MEALERERAARARLEERQRGLEDVARQLRGTVAQVNGESLIYIHTHTHSHTHTLTHTHSLSLLRRVCGGFEAGFQRDFEAGLRRV